MTKLECFNYFGIELKNIRWSWAGLNNTGHNRNDRGEGPVAALTMWTDQISWNKEKRCSVWSVFNLNNKIWKDSAGNLERIEIIKFCINNLSGEFRPVFVNPKSPGVFDETRESDKHYIIHERDFWYKITNFDEDTGECEAESFIK